MFVFRNALGMMTRDAYIAKLEKEKSEKESKN
jgi:hypothetical protein